jgi:hypothetical protein
MASLPESPGPEDAAVPQHEGSLHHPSFLLPNASTWIIARG